MWDIHARLLLTSLFEVAIAFVYCFLCGANEGIAYKVLLLRQISCNLKTLYKTTWPVVTDGKTMLSLFHELFMVSKMERTS